MSIGISLPHFLQNRKTVPRPTKSSYLASNLGLRPNSAHRGQYIPSFMTQI